MAAESNGMFRVDGAELYHTVRGSGPPMVLLPSGGGDAHCADRLVARLSRHMTVLTFDRRGQTRTTVDNRRGRASIERHAADVAALADHVFGEPVAVFGCSTGAVIGLDLARRSPSPVSVLIAHEPPLWTLASEAQREHQECSRKEIRRVLEERSWQEALRVMWASFGRPDPLEREAGVEWEPPGWREIANIKEFLAVEINTTWEYRVDRAGWDALRSGPTTIVPTTGRTSEASPRGYAEALADTLGERLVELAGGHYGYRTHPTAMAEALVGLCAHRPNSV